MLQVGLVGALSRGVLNQIVIVVIVIHIGQSVKCFMGDIVNLCRQRCTMQVRPGLRNQFKACRQVLVIGTAAYELVGQGVDLIVRRPLRASRSRSPRRLLQQGSRRYW